MEKVLMNQQVRQLRFGKPQTSLVLAELPLGSLRDGFVRVQMAAANINPSDLLSIYGVGQYKYSHQPPRVPGFEVVGTVVESRSPNVAVGQRVLVVGNGAWQTYIDADSENVFVIPYALENVHACQLYVNGLTAWVLVNYIAKLNQDDVVIINAGGSAIGKLFAQLANSIGYRLIAVTSDPSRYPYDSNIVLKAAQDLNAQLQALGAIKPTVALDAIGGASGAALMATLADNGRYINYGTLSMSAYEPVFFQHAKDHCIHFSTFFLRHWEDRVGKAARRAVFEQMLAHYTEREIRFDVDRCMTLSEVVSAIELIETKPNTLRGKVILVPDP